MSDQKLIFGPHIENRDEAVSQPYGQLLARHRLQGIACMEVIRHHATDLCHVALAQAAECLHQRDYAIGALSAGIIADAFGLSAAIASIAALTFISGGVVAWFIQESGLAEAQRGANFS